MQRISLKMVTLKQLTHIMGYVYLQNCEVSEFMNVKNEQLSYVLKLYILVTFDV